MDIVPGEQPDACTHRSAQLTRYIKLLTASQHLFQAGEPETGVRDVLSLHCPVLVIDVA